jgi:hypothetical protein
VGEAKKRAEARMRTVAEARYVRGTAVLAYRAGAHPGLDAEAFLGVVESEMRMPSALRPEAAGRSASSLDSLILHPDLDDGRWHLFTAGSGYAAVRDVLPADLVPDAVEPHRFHRPHGTPVAVAGSRALGLRDDRSKPLHPAALKGFLRLDREGRILCEVDAPLAVQRVCVGDDPGHAVHLDVQVAWVESLAPLDALAAADAAGIGEIRGYGYGDWSSRHVLRAEACERWTSASGPGARAAFSRRIGVPDGAWSTRGGQPRVDAAVDQVASVGIKVPGHAAGLVPDPRALSAVRDWLARSGPIVREDGVTACTGAGMVVALVTAAEGPPAIVAWAAATPRPALGVAQDGADGEEPGLAELYREPGDLVGARIANRFEDPEGHVHLAPRLLLRAHAGGATLLDLAHSMAARARRERAGEGAVRDALKAIPRGAAIHPLLSDFVECDAYDPWSLRFPKLMREDIDALLSAHTRGAVLLDLARECIFGMHAGRSRAA